MKVLARNALLWVCVLSTTVNGLSLKDDIVKIFCSDVRPKKKTWKLIRHFLFLEAAATDFNSVAVV